MIRLLNFFCFAVTAMACLALYHVSEQTRVARVQLHAVQQQILVQQQAMKVLEADWDRVSDPARIQQLAAVKLGIADTPSAVLASLELLPRRGENGARDVQQANVEQLARAGDPRLHDAAMHSRE
jgi:cell division protein FtsL